MATSGLKIGIVGCGSAARAHLGRLLAIEGVTLAGCADLDLAAAQALAADGQAPGFADHVEMIRQTSPEAVAIFTPHPAHYRPAMDALQAGCHVFIEKPLSTSVQEAVDIVGLARGRQLLVGVGHHLRLLPSLIRARAMLAQGAIGPVRLVTATMALPWLDSHRGEEHSWRFHPKFAGGGMMADAGVQLIDALLWTTGQAAVEASAIQWRDGPGPDLVTAASVRLADGTPATMALSGVFSGSVFEWNYFGERGRLRATESSLLEESASGPGSLLPLIGAARNVDEDFVDAVIAGSEPCCPADQALDTVRLLEAISRSATIGQVVRLA
jgi:predicted dehydrogenase